LRRDSSGPSPILIIEQVLSREIEEYSVRTRASLAAQELIAEGVNFHPGETIGYVISDARAKNKEERISAGGGKAKIAYDREEYLIKLEKAAADIFNN
jgi:DNA polymerase elongation subunit (family B)